MLLLLLETDVLLTGHLGAIDTGLSCLFRSLLQELLPAAWGNTCRQLHKFVPAHSTPIMAAATLYELPSMLISHATPFDRQHIGKFRQLVCRHGLRGCGHRPLADAGRWGQHRAESNISRTPLNAVFGQVCLCP